MQRVAKMVINKERFRTLFTCLVVIMPIINQYSVFPLTTMDVLSIFCLLCLVFFGKYKIPVKGSAFTYLVYACITTLLFSFLYREMGIVTLGLKMFRLFTLIVVFYIYGVDTFDFDIGYKLYTRIVYIIVALIYIQYVVYVVTGAQTCFLMPNMTLNYMDGWSSNRMIERMAQMYSYRPASIFIEPAHQAEYVLPWIGYTLFSCGKGKEKSKILVCLLVSFALMLGAAFTSIVCCAVIWVIYIFWYIRKMRLNIWYVMGGIVLLGLLFAVVSFILALPNVQQQITGKITSSSDLNRTSSFTLRLLRGAACFKEIGLIHQIFGCGSGSFEYYYAYSGIRTVYDTSIQYVSYMSGWFSLLCNMGITGTSIYFSFLFPSLLSKSSFAAKMMFLVLGMLMFGSDLFETPVYFMVILFVASSKMGVKKQTLRPTAY